MLDGGNMMMPPAAPVAARNLAPVLPLQKLQVQDDAHENSYLNELIRELHQEIREKYIDVRRETTRMGELNQNARTGKLLIKRDPVAGNLAMLKPLAGKQRPGLHVYPLAQVNSSQLTAIWTLSRPKIVPRSFGNNNKAQIQQVLIEKVIEQYDAELFDERFHQEQSLSCMDYGMSAIRVFYDDKLNAMHHLQPIVENVDKTVFEGFGFCRDCLHDGTPDMFAQNSGVGMAQCPECGSYNVSDMTPAQTVSVPQITGAQELTQGDVGAELIPIPALNWDVRKFVHESSYTDYASEVPVRLLRSILGVDIAEEDPDGIDGLRAVNAAGTRGGSIEGLGQENLMGNHHMSSGVSVMREQWYAPEWYMGRKLPEDEQTVSGEIIPKDTPLEQVFPDGMVVAHFNDAEVLAYVGNGPRDIWSAPYHIQSHSGIGKGTTDSVEIAEQLNIAHSAGLNMLKRVGAGGGYAYDKHAMSKSEAQALLKPDGLVALDLRKSDRNINDIIMQFQHRADFQQSINLVAGLSNLMNICFQTTNFTEGVADSNVDINTATGQQMLQAQNQQRSAAPLRMKGYLYARVFEEGVLPMFRKHIVIPKPFGSNDRFALTKCRMISGADMPETVKCDAVPDSEIPVNRFTKQQAVEQMLEKSQYMMPQGGFVGLAQVNPRMAAWFTSQFPGVEIPLFDQTEILMVCQDRIDRLKELVAEAEQLSQISGFFPPPEVIAPALVAKLQIPPSEENPAVKAEVIKEYLDDDEVKTWSPLMLAAVEALIQQLYVNDRNNRFRVPMLDQEGQLGMQANQMMAQTAMQLPMMAAQAQIAGDQQQQEADIALEADMTGRVGDEVQNQLAHERGEDSADAAHKRKLKEIDKQNEGRTASRPSPKPKRSDR